MRKRIRIRIISMLMACCVLFSLLPISAQAAEPPAAVSHQYLSGIAFNRSAKGPDQTDQLYAYSTDGLPQPFKFDPEVAEYNIMLVDQKAQSDMTIQAVITRKGSEEYSDLVGLFQSSGTDINGTGKAYDSDNQRTVLGAQLKLHTSVKLTNTQPHTVCFLTGFLKEDIGVVSGAGLDANTVDTYTFNFYRKATLGQLPTVSDGTTSYKLDETSFDPYVNEYHVEVPAGTTQLTVTAPAYTQTNTVVKYSDGSGAYASGSDATTFTINLTEYTKETDGSVVIPFVLDYAGSGCGADGYYTLTVRFEESGGETDYTPDLTKSDDVTVEQNGEASLSVTVTPMDGDSETSLAYQWYSANNAEGTGKQLIEEATSATYIPPTGTAGTTYYFCEVTRTVDQKTYSATAGPIVVTVEPADSQETYVTDVVIQTKNDEYTIFDGFYADTLSYDKILIPGTTNRAVGWDMLVDVNETVADSPLDYQYTYSLENSEGGIVRAEKTNRIYGGEINVTEDVYGTGGGSFYDPYGIFDRLTPGEYTLKIRVHERDNSNTGVQYSFAVTLLPGIQALDVTAEGKTLPVTPQPDSSLTEESFSNTYSVSVPAGVESLTLSGELNQSGIQFMYGGADKAGEFTQDGFTIMLQEQTENSYTISFSLQYGSVIREYELRVTVIERADWEIATQPQGGTFDKGSVVTLSVGTEGADSHRLTYQWLWSSGRIRNETDDYIDGATGASFTAPTEIGGTKYYYCRVTDPETGAYAYSDVVGVTVNLGEVNLPIIVYQPGTYGSISQGSELTPYRTEYQQGESIDPIQTVLGSTEGGHNSARDPIKVEVVWYYNTEASTEGATLLDSAYTSASTTYSVNCDEVGNYIRGMVYNCTPDPSLLRVGENYFYCVATVIDVADESNRASVTSEFAKITISARGTLDGFEGSGTEEEPYLIKTVADLEKIDEYVLNGNFLSGAVFQFADDIELPEDWEPIGENNGGKGKNLLPFSGIIDGGGYTLTVAYGGKPLLEYTRDATVRNLNIYGEYINGASLLDKVVVDYGPDGIYQQFTDPDIITVENVTLLSGSRTTGSGLVNGGYSSGINDIIIRNCTIEKGVIVGCDRDQSSVGSFVGTLNGRIEDSVSYATVYGVSGVGGLAGKKGQSMGDCIITNSAFLGEVVATGGCVGGILGAGYISDSAPSTPPVSIRNCYVVADITGNSTPNKISTSGFDMGSGIGGILGSEIGVRAARDSAYMCDNHFYGTITDTYAEGGYERVGGILGELGSYDETKLTYQNNYYLENDLYAGIGYQLSVGDWNPDQTAFVAKTSEQFADGTVTALLNQGELKNWVQRAEGEDTNSPYPVHSSVVYVRELTLSGDYKTTYYIGEALDLTGMVITAHWSDGTTTTLSADDVEISGYDNTQRNISLVTVRYGVVEAQFTVTVLQRVQEDATITVYFTLLGDENHTDTDVGGDVHGQRMGGLDTWIPRTAYTMDANATAEDLFTMALEKAGIDFTGNRDNPYNSIYIDGIQSPETGDWIEEFTNGPNSGWMYTVDGKHPDVGLSQWFLSDGENFIFHYTDDYAKEEGSEHWGGATPTEENTSPVLEPEAKVDKDGNATVSVSSKDINTAIETADENGAESIIIAPQVEGDVGSLSVTLPKGSVGDILDGTKAGLTVQSDLGHVELPQDTMEAISETTQDGELTITLAAGTVDEAGKLLAGQEDVTEEALKNCSVTEVTLTSGSTEITSLDGTRMRIALPVDGEVFEDGGSYVVYQITDGGQVEKLSGKCITKDGARFVEVTAAAPGTFVAVAAEVLPFTDVTVENWFYGAVQYVYGRGLMNGTSDTIFSPDGTMNRAMLVTILYRLEGEPAVTAANAFSDVPADTWYTDAVIWADAHGIVEGVGSQQFAPADNITREQMAVMLYRYAQYKGYDLKAGADLSQYTDAADISNWALEAIAWANAEGLITGRTAATIVPGGTATRAEAATILMRFLENAAANK